MRKSTGSGKGPIRILNLFTIMDRGGAETLVMNYYRKIDRSKVQFDFLVHRETPGVYEKEITELGGRIYRMPALRPGRFLQYYKQARRFFRDHPEYRILHAHMSELACIAFLAAYKEGVPIRICHAHNAPHGWDYKMPVKDCFKVMMRPYITHRFTCGQEAGDWLYGKGSRDHLIYMRNAVDTGIFRYDPVTRDVMRKEMELEGNLVLGHVGRFVPQKNHVFLIEILSSMVKRNPSSILLLIGAGPLENRIREMVRIKGLERHVRFMGLREDVNDLLQVMDAFVLPSLYEGVSVALMEAQASGLPCFISAEQPEEAVITDQVSRLFLRRTADQWAAYIFEKCKNYQRKDVGADIQAAGYDIDSNVKKLEQFYLQLADYKE